MDLTGIGSVFDFGSKVIDKIWPNADDAAKAKLAMLQLQQAGEFKELDSMLQLALKQADVNAIEAASEKWWKAGWRPFIGWVCGSALAYNYVIMPFLVYYTKVIVPTAGAMPYLDMGELMTLLIGMLGVGAMRSYDKAQQITKTSD
jgi:hypothetical protein